MMRSMIWGGVRRGMVFCGWAMVCVLGRADPAVRLEQPGVSLRATVAATPFHDLSAGVDFKIVGETDSAGAGKIWLRVTDSLGREATTFVAAPRGRFEARFPRDFEGAAAMVPAVYFVDAARSADAGLAHRAEVAVVVYDSRAKRLPDLPGAFTTDLRGRDGSVDGASPEWSRVRSMVNLYFNSRGAFLAGGARPGFDLAEPADLAAFKRDVALFDFDGRDRDWATPLGRRVTSSFWQAVWDSWFGPSNDNERPSGSGIYPAFTFANDTADLLVAHLRRWQLRDQTEQLAEDNLATLCNEVLLNLAAMQRRQDDPAPRQLAVEEAGAFYYGMFADGELMLEGTGWFHDGSRGDHRRGGVFLGRSLWAVGEALGHPLPGMAEDRLREVLRAGLRWGFGAARGYADAGQPYLRFIRRRDGSVPARPLWRSPGEHAYLLLGMLAACERAEIANMEIFAAGEHGYDAPQTVALLAQTALEALADAVRPEGFWSTYADIDATAVEAMARGAARFADHPSAGYWRDTAVTVADGWLAARPAAGAYGGSVILPVGRRAPDDPGELRYRADDPAITHLTYFHAGLWMQALVELEALTGEARYARRFEEIAGYFCGNNPFDARLFTEIGGVYNFVTDADGDATEDRLHFDLYPESTAFVQIGLLRHLQRRAGINP